MLEGKSQGAPVIAHARERIALDASAEPDVLRMVVVSVEKPLLALAPHGGAALQQGLPRNTGIASQLVGTPLLEYVAVDRRRVGRRRGGPQLAIDAAQHHPRLLVGSRRQHALAFR